MREVLRWILRTAAVLALAYIVLYFSGILRRGGSAAVEPAGTGAAEETAGESAPEEPAADAPSEEPDAGAKPAAEETPDAAAAAVEAGIPEDRLSLNGNYYAVYTGDSLGIRTWEEAEAFCEELGGHLAVIDASQTNSEIFRYLQERGIMTAFFGLSDAEQEGQWRWVGDSQPVYTNWAKGQPEASSAESDYACFSTQTGDGQWCDAKFGYATTRFLCQWNDNLIASQTILQDIPRDAMYLDGHAYYIFENGMGSFYEAQQYCHSRGGELAVIESEEENEALYAYMVGRGVDMAFIGYSDSEKEGTWTWVDGSEGTFTDWGFNDRGQRQPNADNAHEDWCLMTTTMRDGHWNDSQFTEERQAYFCEWVLPEE